MPFQPVPDVALVRVEGRMDGQLTINTLYFEVSGGGITGVNLAALANAVSAWASGSLAVQLSQDWAYQRVTAIDLSAENSFAVEVSDPTTGGVATEAAPNNVAACISFTTAFSGRSFRGRNYIPGVPNAAVTLNTMSDAFMSNITTVYSALVGAGTFLAGWQWVVVSRQTAGGVRPTGIASPVAFPVFKTPYVRSMRSREIGHGA